MTFTELKTNTLKYMTKDQVRCYGDLRKRDTWEAAYDRCGEYMNAEVEPIVDDVSHQSVVDDVSHQSEAVVEPAPIQPIVAVKSQVHYSAFVLVLALTMCLCLGDFKASRILLTDLWSRFAWVMFLPEIIFDRLVERYLPRLTAASDQLTYLYI